MKRTLSVIKADIGSIGGHVAPSRRLLDSMETFIHKHGHGLLTDYNISHTGDDIAILMTHTRGEGDRSIHKLAWDAFVAGTAVAKEQGSVRRRPGSAEGRVLRQREGHGPGGGRDGVRGTPQ